MWYLAGPVLLLFFSVPICCFIGWPITHAPFLVVLGTRADDELSGPDQGGRENPCDFLIRSWQSQLLAAFRIHVHWRLPTPKASYHNGTPYTQLCPRWLDQPMSMSCWIFKHTPLSFLSVSSVAICKTSMTKSIACGTRKIYGES